MMGKLRKWIKIQLIILPLIIIITLATEFIVYGIQKSKYKEISLEVFIDKVTINRVQKIAVIGNRYEITIAKTNEKYFHLFNHTEDRKEFEKRIIKYFSPIFHIKKSRYKSLLLLLGDAIIFILGLNILAVWFITIFDLLRSEFIANQNKWIWLVCLIILPFVAPFFYVYIADKQKLHK